MPVLTSTACLSRQAGRWSRSLARKLRWEQPDEEFAYDPSQLDHDVVAPDQIRTLVRTFRDKRPTEIVPGRTAVPKALIFANDRVRYREFQFICFVDAAMLASGARA